MNESKVRILIADDEPDLRQLHKLYFEACGFDVVEADNGKAALELLANSKDKIDVVVTDIVMPEMNGYELCKAIKNDPDKSDIIVVFVSSLSTLEEKTKGYSYGVDDYFIKPIQPEVIKHKIQSLIDYRNKNLHLKSEVKNSQQAAMQIMNFYSDLGQVLEFYKASINAKSYRELAELIFNVMRSFGLRSSVQIIIPDNVLNFGDAGEVSSLEANIIELSRAKSRFFEYGVRLIINYDHFSLLVKNMPISDPDRCGTLRDSLGILCNAVEARINSLIDQSVNYKKTQITADVKSVLGQTQNTFSQIEKDTLVALESMTEEIEDSFISLGLSDEQEQKIREIIKDCTNRTHTAFELSRNLYNMFGEINSNLDAMQSLNRDQKS